MADAPQLLVRDRWLCDSVIDDGPNGVLWRAFDERLRRSVTLRIVPVPLIGDPQVRRRIERLLTITADLQHDNMAYLYDAFQDDDLGVVLIGELIDGPTFAEVVDRLDPAAPETVAAVGSQLADGLEAIHDRGLAHRALSPDNIRITWDGTVKILGFSATRLLADSTATPAGGTELEQRYLAPEQLTGGASDQRTDIYTLGLLLWELATAAPHPTVAQGPGPGALDGPPPEVPSVTTVRADLPGGLAECLDVATRHDAAARWQDAQTLRDHLAPWCPGRPTQLVREAITSGFALHG